MGRRGAGGAGWGMGVVSMTSLRLALGMAIGLTLSAAAVALARHQVSGNDPVVEPSAAPGVVEPTGRGQLGPNNGIGPEIPARPSGSASNSAAASPSAGSISSGIPPGAIIELPPVLPPPVETREPVPEATSSSPVPPDSGVDRLTATFSIPSTWEDGFVANVEISNETAGDQAWQVRLTFPTGVIVPDGSEWSATKEGETGTIVFTGQPVPAGGTRLFGFQAEKSGQNRKDFVPTACTVNGNDCEGF